MYHVYPVNDEQEHVLEGTTCPCEPKILIESGEMIVVHNAWDFREVIEQAERIKDSA